MLYERYDEGKLAAALIPGENWHPFPTATDRAGWRGIRKDVRRAIVARGGEAAKAEWPALPASLYLDFARTGNRTPYEGPYFSRRSLLGQLVLAECLEGKNRLLDAVMDRVWAICEESSWCLPAHETAGAGLSDTAKPTVDLFAAETGALLAWTHYLLGPQLDGRSPLVCPRIRREVGSRILTPCLERDDFWWMGFRSQRVNNWTPWINSNWLTCALLLEPEPQQRVKHVAKSLRSLDVFVDGYPRDGGCDEGPSYWTRAGASLFDCLDLLHSATGGALDVFQVPLVREIGRFICRAHIHENWFVNFADAPAVMGAPAGLVFQYGQRIGDAAMQRFGAKFRPPKGRLDGLAQDSLGRALRSLFSIEDLLGVRPAAPLLADVWLPDTQLMVARSRGGTEKGFTLAAKGGHNAESHNHNDVGNFILYADGQPVLIDVGVETYTRKTFSAERYAIWTMQSQYHNLPTINGVMQKDGRDFKAKDVRYAADDRTATLSLDIAAAYPPEAGLKSWVRTLALERAGGVVVEDRYELTSKPKTVTLSLMTPCRVTVRGGVLVFGRRKLPNGRTSGSARLLYNAAVLKAGVEEVRVSDPRLASIWGPKLFRVLLKARAPERSGLLALRIAPPRDPGRRRVEFV